MIHKFIATLVALLALLSPADAAQLSWIDTSNRHAQVLLEIIARYSPEGAASLGVDGHDSEIFDLRAKTDERQTADLTAAIVQLEALRSASTDTRITQDLDIMLKSAHAQIQTLTLNNKYLLPFSDVPQAVFSGFQNLLDPRVPKARYAAALTRLRRYAGAEKGYEPITSLARARYEEKAGDPALLGPWIVEAQQYLDNQNRYLDGIEDLLRKSKLSGWQKDMRTLRRQFSQYGDWVRSTVLPRARQTNRLPPELYADNLRNVGVEMDPRELMERAQANFVQTRDELITVSRILAEQRHWQVRDYRDVIRMLKQQRIPTDQLLNVYSDRLAQIEAIVEREHIVTLPTRKAVIRLATEAESAAGAAPHLDPPRLIGNTGEAAEFVIPTSNPNAAAGVEMDDFNYDAIAWTLTAHEARPGHELQFARMLEVGVSTARVIYALNSANLEGWALYAEAVMKKYLPLEGQVGVLQMRMVREARAFLDPMLNLGLIEPAAAKRLLMEETMLSEPMAKQEIDRYTFDSPGQATAYFYGYQKLDALRTQVELALTDRFNELAYHDFIVSQGILPFDLLEKVVMKDFVPAQAGAAASK